MLVIFSVKKRSVHRTMTIGGQWPLKLATEDRVVKLIATFSPLHGAP